MLENVSEHVQKYQTTLNISKSAKTKFALSTYQFLNKDFLGGGEISWTRSSSLKKSILTEKKTTFLLFDYLTVKVNYFKLLQGWILQFG